MNEPLKREKESTEEVLPPVSDFVALRKSATFNYINLNGDDVGLDFGELAKSDPAPLPMPIDREGYCAAENSDRYWATGHGDFLNVQSALAQFGAAKAEKIFDFGCSTGRFLRHVHYFSDIEPHGSDFAPANVKWTEQYLPEQIKIVVNSSAAELPYANETFCLTTAFSVFTHIDADENQWLDELTRITKRNGLLYLTIQNQSSWDRVNSRPGMLEHLATANGIEGNLQIQRSTFESPMPSQRIVLRMSRAEIYNCNVWVTNEYVQENWTRKLELLQISGNAHNSFQSVAIFRRL